MASSGRNKTKIIELKPIRETTEDFDQAEQRLKTLFRLKIYLPLIRAFNLKPSPFKNSIDTADDLLEAIQEGTVFFSRGQFRGSFNAAISKELKELGAVWDRKNAAWKLPASSLPREVRDAISGSEWRFKEKIAGLDRKLQQILPEDIAGQVKVSDLFDKALWKTDRAFAESLKGITVAPTLPPAHRKRIADEWQNNLKLHIKDFAQDEITKLRADLKKSVFAGNRYESAVKSIQASYEVSANKAKFLAKQETSLLMTKFKETRYEDAGVDEYEWGCVAGSKNHPVRPAHKALEGKVFTWKNPPITTAPGQAVRRNNPGQDYGCRCFAKPRVRLKVDQE